MSKLKNNPDTTTWAKTYVGHGTKIDAVPNAIEVVLDMTTAEAFIFEYEGKKYIKFTLAQRKEADRFGRTHSAYLKSKVEGVGA